MSRDTDELTDHEYDGITEYDNPLPRWWVWLFYGCIVFAAVYIPWYHFGPGPLMLEEYQAEMAAAVAAMPVKQGPSASDMTAARGDATRLAAGKDTFAKLCVACHTADGGGLVGPNLTDDFWIHGGAMADLVHVITEGVPEKGMISWKTQLSGAEIVNVAAYIKTLRGTKPANPKAPEGEPYVGD